MSEIDVGVFREIVGTSLYALADVYIERDDGSLEYRGQRPGPQWEGHGYFPVYRWLLSGGMAERVVVHKHRWLLTGTTRTCHSRPPDDHGVGACSLIVVLCLWSWLSGARGLHNRQSVFPDLDRCCSERTLQRWLDRACARALEVQQAIREALIQRSEPRPVETLFPGGLSPPEGLTRRHWMQPSLVVILWRAFAMLLGGSFELDVPAALLLAEARRRWSDPESDRI